MLTINLQNAEELVFYDKQVQQLFPEFKDIFKTWVLGKRVSALSHLSKKAIIDFLNSLEDQHVERLEKHFDSKITLELVDPSLVHHYTFSLIDAEQELEQQRYFSRNFFVWRNESELYMSFWR